MLTRTEFSSGNGMIAIGMRPGPGGALREAQRIGALPAPDLAHKRGDRHCNAIPTGQGAEAARRPAMAQTTGRLYDEFAKLMNDAAGVAQGVRREFDSVLRTQAERLVRDMELVHREEFEAVKEMARLAREENEALKARIAALEARLGTTAGTA